MVIINVLIPRARNSIALTRRTLRLPPRKTLSHSHTTLSEHHSIVAFDSMSATDTRRWILSLCRPLATRVKNDPLPLRRSSGWRRARSPAGRPPQHISLPQFFVAPISEDSIPTRQGSVVPQARSSMETVVSLARSSMYLTVARSSEGLRTSNQN